SGSFNVGLIAAPGQTTEYGDEKVEGGEVGFKSRLFDRRLALDVAAYDYKYADLQVGTIEPSRGTSQAPQARTVNAGRAKVYGVDFSAAWRPAEVEGLTLNLNANWNKA